MKDKMSRYRAKIFILCKERGIDNDMLHDLVYSLTGKESLKDITLSEASKIIALLTGEKYTAAGMATDKQLKFIYGLMKDIGWIDEDGKPDESRLDGFLKERFKLSHRKWLTSKIASKAIEALKAMKNRTS